LSRGTDHLRSRLAQAPPLLLDGATGTELQRRGVDTGLPLWSARALTAAPDVLARIHRDHVEAGAEVLTANTFRTHRRNLQHAGMGDRARELTSLAVEVAREAFLEVDSDGWVAGSVAPLEDCYSPELVPADAALEAEHAEMVRNLVDAGVDLLLVETMNTVREALAAGRAAVATGLPTAIGLVCGRNARLLSGEPLGRAVAALAALEPDLVVVNCTPTPDLAGCLDAARQVTDIPLGAYGNVGYADDETGWVNTDSVDPDAYSAYAATWLDAGVRLVGGCCGTGPAHVRELRKMIDARSAAGGRQRVEAPE